jgi:hypothetical protein
MEEPKKEVKPLSFDHRTGRQAPPGLILEQIKSGGKEMMSVNVSISPGLGREKNTTRETT